MKDEKEDVMQIPQYIFKSPYSSPVQFGQLDPNSVKDQNTQSSFNAPNETAQKAQNFVQSQQKSVEPTVTQNKIDIYA
jgi:hypothetical protein